MKKFAIIAGSILVGLITIAVVGYLAGPTFIASSVEEELRVRLENRGVEADWTSFEAGFGGEFVMREARFEAPRFGASLTADSISVEVDPMSAFEATPSVEVVELRGVRVTLDLAADSEGEEAAGEGGERRASLIRKILADPPVLRVHDAQMSVVRGESAVVDIESSVAEFEPFEGGWYVTADGASTLKVEEVPEVFRERLPWQLAASLDPLGLSTDFELSGPDGAPLISLEEEGLVRAAVGALAGRLEAKTRSADVEARDVALRLGPETTPGIDLVTKKIRVTLDGRRVERVVAMEPIVTVTPSRLGPVREGVSWLQALAGRKATPASSEETSGYTPPRWRILRAWRRANSLASTTNLFVEDLVLDIKLASPTGSTHEPITVVESMDARVVDGALNLRGESAGGVVEANVQLVPGSVWPAHVTGAITDVRLDEMPGMPEKRSELPNRGTSGRVGGELDAVFAASFPLRGSEGSIVQQPAYIYGSLDWSNGMIDLEGVSDEALEGIDLSLDLIARGYPALGEFDVLDATATYGPAVVRGTGSLVDAPLDPVVTVRAQLEEIECQELFRSAPLGLLGPYRAVEIEGKWAPKMYMKLPLFRPRGFRMKIEEYEDLCTITNLKTYNRWLPEVKIAETAPSGLHLHARPLPPEEVGNTHYDDVFWLNRPFIKRVTEGVSSEEVVVNVGPGTPEYVPLHELPGYVGGAAFLSEEMDFYEDGPISLGLIKKAIRLNLEKGRFQYGGSTVTQQLVKNLFLTRDKTLARKFQEALISWRITEVVSKDRVLELYLNVIEFGPDIYGIGPAARYYFQKDARQLTSNEAIFLAMLKPAPWYGADVIKRGKTPVTGWWAGRYEELYQRLIDYGYLTRADAEASKPYYLEWDDDGKYIPTVGAVEETEKTGVDLLDIFAR